MRPGLAREILRNATAYRAGRAVANGLTIGYLSALAVGSAWWIAMHELPTTPLDVLEYAGPVFGAVIGGAVAILLWELAHALFDLADAALKSIGTGE